jgi:hypothetical protein
MDIKHRKKVATLTALFLVFIPLSFCLAVSLKVSPSEIEIKAQEGKKAEAEIIIENPGENVALFEVYPDDFSDLIKASPSSFTLEAGEKRGVILISQNKESGVFSTYLSVKASPLAGGKLSASSGVKIPLRVVIQERQASDFLGLVAFIQSGGNNGFVLILFCLLSGFSAGLALFFHQRRKTSKN